MKRRDALKNLVFITGGVLVLPSCLQKEAAPAQAYNYLSLTGAEEAELAEIGAAIIPAGQTPGAKDTYAHLYALRMIDDCTEKETQEKFLNGYKQLQARAKNAGAKSFATATAAQKNSLVAHLEGTKEEKEDINVFYTHFKRHLIKGYLNSKPVAGGILKYELVPARYNGAALLKQTQNPA